VKNGQSGNLSIRIENNFDPEAPRRAGANIGLKNVRQRVDATFAKHASFDVCAAEGKFQVSMQFPTQHAG